MRLGPIALTPAVVLLTGCAALAGVHSGTAGGGQSPPGAVPSNPSTSVIPWVSATPAGWPHGLATPVPGSAPKRCEVADLRAGFRGDAYGGVVYLVPQTSGCLTGGVPSVELSGNDGPIATIPASTSANPAVDVVLEREFVIWPDLQPGEPVPPSRGGAGGAIVQVDWRQTDAGSDVCAAGVKKATSMRLGLPGQANTVLVENFLDQLGAPLTVCASSIRVGPIGKDPSFKAVNPPRYWGYTIKAPTSAVVGHTIDFTVTLQNVYYRALQFANGCPSYVEALGGPNGWTTGKEWYLVNCEPIGPLQPGASATLAMKITIPASAPTGAYELMWDLDTGDVNYGAVDATVNLLPPP